ncbi:MAG: methyltransferase domain-containing protein [Candidatus Micrarchaeota archaeon]|nr:methyltransferase domain-containing protein [Candidatus Micrarchaeota archaeon]
MERILNVGCGKHLLHRLHRHTPIEERGKKCGINNDRFPYGANTFDRVFAEFVIAHLTNQSNLIKESRRVLRKGGTIEILTNNAGFWGVFGSTFYGKYEENNRRKGHPLDKQYSLFTPISLRNMLETFGFREIRYEYLLTTPGREDLTPLPHRIAMRLLTLITPRFSPHIRITARK